MFHRPSRVNRVPKRCRTPTKSPRTPIVVVHRKRTSRNRSSFVGDHWQLITRAISFNLKCSNTINRRRSIIILSIDRIPTMSMTKTTTTTTMMMMMMLTTQAPATKNGKPRICRRRYPIFDLRPIILRALKYDHSHRCSAERRFLSL